MQSPVGYIPLLLIFSLLSHDTWRLHLSEGNPPSFDLSLFPSLLSSIVLIFSFQPVYLHLISAKAGEFKMVEHSWPHG